MDILTYLKENIDTEQRLCYAVAMFINLFNN